MIIPVGTHVANQQLLKITRQGNDFKSETMFPVRFVPLVSD